MNQDFRFKNLTRALLLLPFIVPTVLSTIAWQWILDPAFSVINWCCRDRPDHAARPELARQPAPRDGSLIVVNVWRGLPFYAITLLAGLQPSPELYEAATIDGASTWGRFRWVTLPLMKPVIFIVTMFSVIFTFSDFQLIYVLTHGGPANATQVFATYAFDIAMGGGQLGQGAAIAVTALLLLPGPRPHRPQAAQDDDGRRSQPSLSGPSSIIMFTYAPPAEYGWSSSW